MYKKYYVKKFLRDDSEPTHDHIYEADSLEEAHNICERLSETNDDDNAFYDVRYYVPEDLWLWEE
ncbi:hypothetical protein [Mammaliicoccus sciuri]|uniref:hypothetical protein n=1 Tax=Mammaliicoccus sciuri TaxID=1296 RepID=UPI002B260CEE|nr:hypothetical protein [Mammaliicoccus sciuri]WQK75245.1 hypothetical protein P3U33_05805 [Mammaliicoccus sciuri]